jgi:PadR family transcriptional regulator PadR
LKKGSAELLILSLIEHRTRHGNEIGKLIEGRWVEKAGQRRRRYYKLTTKGKKMLGTQRSTWANLVNAIRLIAEAENA